ncbi:retinol dehydrogenase 12 [Fistulifera solaris]|uniref:Retinol dehydrogenase 12 n=1 Tax=Fistulifera solaris TaxID=1519565 RepID=A0A1Z5K058_FISSO|nr:retinol dehydrogenase 12 [Fistulifera solaris]|eukprot:GAX19466.1 retinol dehydrogenase 12 [Fistulifera solaris]
MCKLTPIASTETKKPGKTRGGLSKMAVYLSASFAIVIAVFPMIISEMIGGWTAKYTSPVYFTPNSIPDLTGKVAIVTGANTGIGYHTALELARKNAQVIVASRDPTKGQAAVARIQEATDNRDVRFLPLDLSSLASVRSFAQAFQALQLPLNVLILNAGIMKSPGAQFIGKNMTQGFELTQDGFEVHIGVNHIGHFYLTQLLRDSLIASAPSRVVSVSSIAEQGAYQPDGIRFELWKPLNVEYAAAMGYEDGMAYGQSKLANALFAKELAEQLKEHGVTTYSCHPGVIVSELTRYLAANIEEEAMQKSWWSRMLLHAFGKYFELAQMKTADGALTQLHLAVSNVTELSNGEFYHPIGRLMGNPTHAQGSNETLQKELWRETERMIRETGF